MAIQVNSPDIDTSGWIECADCGMAYNPEFKHRCGIRTAEMWHSGTLLQELWERVGQPQTVLRREAFDSLILQILQFLTQWERLHPEVSDDP